MVNLLRKALIAGGLAAMLGCGNEQKNCQTNADCDASLVCGYDKLCKAEYTCEDGASQHAYGCQDADVSFVLGDYLEGTNPYTGEPYSLRDSDDPHIICLYNCKDNNPTIECISGCDYENQLNQCQRARASADDEYTQETFVNWFECCHDNCD